MDSFLSNKAQLFCHCCVKASRLSGKSIRADQVFVTSGFSKWKKAIQRFKDHEFSIAHKNALLTMAASKNPIDQQLQTEAENIRQKCQQSLLKQLSTLHYLLCQGIAICNDHAGGSNLSVMLEEVLGESHWVNEGKYQSPECINEMIEIMAHKVLHSLLNDIQAHKWFSILADETQDLSNHEQMVVYLRWVSDAYEVFEDLVGLIRLDNITSDTIYSVLKDTIVHLGLDFCNCRD